MLLVRLGRIGIVVLLLIGLLMVVSTPSHAHETKEVGDGAFLVIVGFVTEPPYTDERNGLDLIIRQADDSEPVPHLQDTLFAEITSPDGTATRELPLRAQWGNPGYYTSDFILTQPGVYQIRVWGHIHDVEFDETFDSHTVRPIEELRFPD